MTHHTQNDQGLQKRFIYSILLTSLILAAEIIGGIISGSLALLSDAAHVFSDIFALALSFFALRLAMRPPDDQHSYGWHRAEVLAALVNGVSLLVIAIGIWIEAFKRWQNPVEIRSTEMMIIAVILGHVAVATARRATTSPRKFMRGAIWLTLSVLCVLLAIPWFRPLVPQLGLLLQFFV